MTSSSYSSSARSRAAAHERNVGPLQKVEGRREAGDTDGWCSSGIGTVYQPAVARSSVSLICLAAVPSP